MTLQERVAFDAEQAGAMESEGTKLKGELDVSLTTVLYIIILCCIKLKTWV